MNKKREQWGSKAGFILAAAGSAVGLGNVWRFPYLVGMNGGAAFVVVYVLMAVTVGITLMLAEFSLGRATRRNSVGAFRTLSTNPLWRLVGWGGIATGGFLILSYYGIIGGWTIKYMFHSLTGLMEQAGAGQSSAVLGTFLEDTRLQVVFQLIAMGITTLVVASGVKSGIERTCKIMMPALFVLLLVLIVRSLTLPGAAAGLEFYLSPDFSKLTGQAILEALGQSFFSLSLGMGIAVTYGSYIRRKDNLPRSALTILGLDTGVALLAGLAIFPAVFAMGIEPTAGVGLTFVTLPGVFAKMPGGMYFSFAFFLLLSIAALTSMMSLLEVTVSFLVDELHISRKLAAWGGGAAITLMGLPSAISLGSNKLAIVGMPFFDFMDSVANYLLMPATAIGISLFVGWKWSEPALQEVTNNGTVGFAVGKLWIVALKFFAPTMIALVMVRGWPF